MVDDALARASDKSIKWLINNWKWLQWALVGSVLAGAGGLYWIYSQQSTSDEASHTLARAVEAEQAWVIPPDKDDRTDEQKKLDVRRTFASNEDKLKAAQDDYHAVAAEFGGSGAAILAKLGEGGIHLDKAEWDPAIAAFSIVLDSALAQADVDVKGRALEGKGFAQEAKGELDAALKSFEAIGELPTDSFKATSMYHRARVLEAQKQPDKAIEVLKQARKLLEKAKIDATLVTPQHPFQWIDKAVEDRLRALDPSAVPPKVPGGAGGLPALPEDIKQKLREQGLNPDAPGLPPQ